MSQIVVAIEEVIPESAGKIGFDPTPLPHPSSADDTALNQALGPLQYRSLVQGVRDTVEVFRTALEADRLDLERALRT